MTVEVVAAREVTGELVRAFGRLLPQLSTSADPVDAAALARVVAREGTTLLVARVEGEVVGTLTLVVFEVATGARAWIEDVVVDGAARGRGVGEALLREAVRRAGEAGARTLDLTSRPARAAAVRLYERVGFRRRESDLYRLDVIR